MASFQLQLDELSADVRAAFVVTDENGDMHDCAAIVACSTDSTVKEAVCQ